VARFRLTLLVALLTCCLCALFAALAGASSGARHRHAHRATPCAKRASFHASKRHPRRRHNGGRCPKQHGGKGHAKSHRPVKRRPKTGGHDHGRTRPNPAAAKSDSCPGASLAPDEENLEVIRIATLCLVNRERADNGESALQPNGRLQQAAQGHTESMVDEDYFEHVSPNGDTPLSRMIAADYIYSSQVGYEVGENIGWGTLWLATPNAIVAAWMASPGHRANILDTHFRDTAIGVSPHAPASLAHGQAGAIYTQDFGVIITG
jgi:uncharacterized protein YkwD